MEAFLAGFALSLLIGPSFFALLQTSLERGFRAAFWFANGVFVSDAFLVAVSFLGASRLFVNPSAGKVIGVVGGIFLVLIGIYNFRKKVNLGEERQTSLDAGSGSPGMRFLKGFFMNMTNPGTWIFWFVTVGTVSAKYVNAATGKVIVFRVLLFFLVTLGTVFSMDILKAFVAHKIKKFINARTVRIVNKVVGVLLVLFGLYLMLCSLFPAEFDDLSHVI